MILRILLIVISAGALGFALFLLFSKTQKPWNEMTDKEQKKKKILIAGSFSVFLAGIIASLLLGKKK